MTSVHGDITGPVIGEAQDGLEATEKIEGLLANLGKENEQEQITRVMNDAAKRLRHIVCRKDRCALPAPSEEIL